MKINPEDALRQSSGRFYRRFEAMERAARDSGRDLREMDAEQLGGLWREAKATGT